MEEVCEIFGIEYSFPFSQLVKDPNCPKRITNIVFAHVHLRKLISSLFKNDPKNKSRKKRELDPNQLTAFGKSVYQAKTKFDLTQNICLKELVFPCGVPNVFQMFTINKKNQYSAFETFGKFFKRCYQHGNRYKDQKNDATLKDCWDKIRELEALI